MRILIATALYPPDTAPAAGYAKELARRLAGEHSVRVATYGSLPEGVPGVHICAVRKALPLPMRLIAYTRLLFNEARSAERVIILNGASVELPASIALALTRRRAVVVCADQADSEARTARPLLRTLGRFVERGRETISEVPPPRPEILPFEAYPEEALRAHEDAWRRHLQQLKEKLL